MRSNYRRGRIMLTALLTFSLNGLIHAQEKCPIRFGKVTAADFNVKAPAFDSGADAVVVADVGNSEFLGNTKGWFSLQFKHSKRIKILNKKGFDAGNIEIRLFQSGSAVEKLEGLKAITYNLENGQVVETRLDDKSLFTDKVSKNLVVKKFTFPALKEGSIIEFTYTQTSDFLSNLQPWEFQGEYPVLWSEYEVDMPNFFEYVTLSQGFLNFSTKKEDVRNNTFRITVPGGADRDENVSFDDKVTDRHWVVKDMPSLREERYTTTTDNYIAKLEFQLSRYNFPNSVPKDKMGNWFSVSKALMEDEDFGAGLTGSNGWLDEECKRITKDAKGPMEKAMRIYAFVRDNFKCTGHGYLETQDPLKTVFKNRSGNEAGLNLLLTAMLLHEKIQANPVILSTRAHGFTHEYYPLLSRYNYVVSQAIIDSVPYMLDASENWLGFGRLPARCYNGHSRVITPQVAYPLYLDADSLTEGKSSLVFMSNEKKGYFSGRMQSVPGYFESCEVREKVKEKGEPEYFKAVQRSFPGEVEFSNTSIDSLKINEMPVGVNYDFAWKLDGEDIIYFNPMLGQGYKENPFAAAERKYPVEMLNAIDETYTLNMEVPEGYDVEELPKSTKVLFNDDEGYFQYLCIKGGDGIQFQSKLKLKKANFKAEDYATLREFFAFVVKKQSEQIVFKKKK